ncbi:MAG: molybdenum cofactor biosynthesis protein [Proteobacteria bacterium]|nr:molybdenum cofactor biosynthesis protein [Pseudomonadota bacterium]
MRIFILSALYLLAVSDTCLAKEYTLKDQSTGVIERRSETMKLRPNVGVIVASDTQRDESGVLGASLLEKAGFKVIKLEVVGNLDVKNAIATMLANKDIQAILCIGGTGISPHDITVESIKEVCEKELPGYGEYLRMLTRERWEKQEEKLGLLFIDTRANACVTQSKLIFAIPGSPDATELSITKIIIPGLPTLYGQLQKKS